MKLTNDNLTFGKFSFTDNRVKEVFYKNLYAKKCMAKKNIYKKINQNFFCRDFVEKENKVLDREFIIGKSKINNKDVFTCSSKKVKNKAYGTNKYGKQNFFDFILGIFGETI